MKREKMKTKNEEYYFVLPVLFDENFELALALFFAVAGREIRVWSRKHTHPNPKLVKRLFGFHEVQFSSEFYIALKDYKIKVPKIVRMNIADTILVNVSGNLVNKN